MKMKKTASFMEVVFFLLRLQTLFSGLVVLLRMEFVTNENSKLVFVTDLSLNGFR